MTETTSSSPVDNPAPPIAPTITLGEALKLQTPVAWVTPLLVLGNVVVAALLVFDGLNPIWPPPGQLPLLVEWGANFAPRTADGEWWRLVTSTFLHAGLIHLGMNMWALWNLGRVTEQLCGNVGFLLLYLTTGIIGSVGSLYATNAAVSVGASGAIFGIAGVLIGFVWRQRRRLPREFVLSIRGVGMNVLVLLVVFQFVPYVDNAGHAAGFVSGLLGGLLVSQPITLKVPRGRWWRNLLATAAGAGIIAAGIVLHPGPPTDLNAEMERVSRLEMEAVREYNAIMDRLDANAVDSEEAADLLDTRVADAFAEIVERMEQFERVPARSEEKIALLTDLYRTRRDSVRQTAEGLRDGKEESFREAMRLRKKAEQISEQLDALQ